jgi:hypothetical protein
MRNDFLLSYQMFHNVTFSRALKYHSPWLLDAYNLIVLVEEAGLMSTADSTHLQVITFYACKYNRTCTCYIKKSLNPYFTVNGIQMTITNTTKTASSIIVLSGRNRYITFNVPHSSVHRFNLTSFHQHSTGLCPRRHIGKTASSHI